MITKHELLAFVNDLPEYQFQSGQERLYKPYLAETLYTFCCGGVVLAAITREGIEDLGYDVSKVDTETLEALVTDIQGDLDYEDLLIRALEGLYIPKEDSV